MEKEQKKESTKFGGAKGVWSAKRESEAQSVRENILYCYNVEQSKNVTTVYACSSF